MSNSGNPEGRVAEDYVMLRWDQHVGHIPPPLLQEKSQLTFWRTIAAVKDTEHCLQYSLSSEHCLGIHMALSRLILLGLLDFQTTLKCKIPELCLHCENILPLLFSDKCVISR